MNEPAHATVDGRARTGPRSAAPPESSLPTPTAVYCTPIRQCPILAPEYDDPNGVPISAIFFGGRRRRRCRWSPSRATGCTASSWARPSRQRPPRPPRVRWASCAATPWLCAVHRLRRRRLRAALGRRRQGRGRRPAAEDLLRQLVPPVRERRVPVAGVRRERVACSSGPSSASRAWAAAAETPDRPRADARVARHRRAGPDAAGAGGGARGRPGGGRGRGAADRGVVRPSRRHPPQRSCGSSSTGSRCGSACPDRNERGPRPAGRGPRSCGRGDQIAVTFSAWGPLGPCVISNWTRWASSRER